VRQFELSLDRTGQVLSSRAMLASGMLSRMKGLLGRRGLPQGESIILRPCSSVHTLFMRFTLDVLYLDKEQRVVKLVRDLKPWRLSAARRAHEAIEFEAGHLQGVEIEPGDKVTLREVG